MESAPPMDLDPSLLDETVNEESVAQESAPETAGAEATDAMPTPAPEATSSEEVPEPSPASPDTAVDDPPAVAASEPEREPKAEEPALSVPDPVESPPTTTSEVVEEEKPALTPAVEEPLLKAPPPIPTEDKPAVELKKPAECRSCGAIVDGMKFCGSCGTKVEPSACLVCSTELISRAKFCPECGTARGSTERPVPEPEVLPSTRPVSKGGLREEASREATSGGDGATTPSRIASVKLAEGADSSAEKKKFSVKQSPKCAVCGKSVYETERAVDSVGTVFHKECFRCKTCKVSLVGKQKIIEPESGSIKLTNAQYLVAREGSPLGKQGEFFCEKHAVKVRASIVKSKAVDEKSRDDAELKGVASLRKEQNEEARNSMKVRVGDMLPTCARCGRPIDKGQKAFTTGIQKMHEVCPTKEESDKAIRTTRYFVRKAPDRLAASLTCDKDTRHPHTFLYELDKALLNEALMKNVGDDISIRYVPDAQARTAANRKLVAPSSDAAREFDMSFKDFYEFTFKNPKANDAEVKPVLDKKAKELTVTKFHHANGVLQTLVAVFKYEEETRLCGAERIDISLEMWPPEAAAEMASQLNPLADIKQKPDMPVATTEPTSDTAKKVTVQEQALPSGAGDGGSRTGAKGSVVLPKGKPNRKASTMSQGKKDCVVM